MRYFRFIGDPRDGGGPERVTVYGLEFGRHEPTGVESEAVSKKLAGNSHFQEMMRDDTPSEEPDAEDGFGAPPIPRRRGRPPKYQ